DWSSDVCSSDLTAMTKSNNADLLWIDQTLRYQFVACSFITRSSTGSFPRRIHGATMAVVVNLQHHDALRSQCPCCEGRVMGTRRSVKLFEEAVGLNHQWIALSRLVVARLI